MKTDHVLFIAAGAFHVSKPSDLIPELQGRFPIRVELEPLTDDDFVRILTEPENALTKQYAALLATEGVDARVRRRRRSPRSRASPRWSTSAWRTSARAACTRSWSALLDDLPFEAPDLGEHDDPDHRRPTCASGSTGSSRTRTCRSTSSDGA